LCTFAGESTAEWRASSAPFSFEEAEHSPAAGSGEGKQLERTAGEN
jgi:hypothetical protein